MDTRWFTDRGKIYNQVESTSSTGFVSDTYNFNATAGVFPCSVQESARFGAGGQFRQAAEGEIIEKNRMMFCASYFQAYIHEGDIFLHSSAFVQETYIVTSVMNVVGDHLECVMRRRPDVTLTGG